ncbi:MAG: 4Fe-4S binding protein [Candidatus Lokiarchaeota archaeon]
MKESREVDIPGVEWNDPHYNFINIDQEKCIGCGYCVNVCLGECYRILNNKAIIQSLNRCLECSACWYICPENAIDFNYPQGGKGFRSNFG